MSESGPEVLAPGGSLCRASAFTIPAAAPSASAYSETLVAFARARRLDEARQAIAAMGVTVVPLTDTIAERAAELRARHDRLRLPDAIVLATAQELGGRLLSYEPRLSQLAGK